MAKSTQGMVQEEYRIGALLRSSFRYNLEIGKMEYVEQKMFGVSRFMVTGTPAQIQVINEAILEMQEERAARAEAALWEDRKIKIKKDDEDLLFETLTTVGVKKPTLVRKGMFKNVYVMHTKHSKNEILEAMESLRDWEMLPE
jgi:hypothetical protein